MESLHTAHHFVDVAVSIHDSAFATPAVILDPPEVEKVCLLFSVHYTGIFHLKDGIDNFLINAAGLGQISDGSPVVNTTGLLLESA